MSAMQSLVLNAGRIHMCQRQRLRPKAAGPSHAAGSRR